MTTNEIIATVRRKILETGEDLITDDVLLQYANAEYRSIRRKLKMSADVIKADITCSNGICTLPTDYGAMYSFAVDSSNNVYVEYPIADYALGDFDRGMTVQNGSLTVSDTDITTLTIRYYPSAVVLSAVQDPEIDELFHESIMYGTVSRAQEDLQDEILATFYRTKADAEFKDKSETQSTYEETNQRGGTMFETQQLISL